MTCIFLCVAFLTDAQSLSMSIADSFLQKQQYFEAGVFYEKVLFESSNDEIRFLAATKKIECLKQQQKFEGVIEFVNQNYHSTLTSGQKCTLKYEQMICSYLSANFENAISLSALIEGEWPDYDGIATVSLLKILSLNELQQWRQADSLSRIFIAKYTTADTAGSNLYSHLPKLKNEKKAQTLSTLLPGAGLFYAGKPLEGITSILLQSVAAYFGIISYNQKYYLSAWLVGLGLFGSFHNGSVRRSEILVKQYNRKEVIRFNEKVKNELINMLRTKK